MAALIPILVLALAPSWGRPIHSPPVVHGADRAPAAWAALWRGQLWVCWREGPQCWRRIDPRARTVAGKGLLELDDPEAAALDVSFDPVAPAAEIERLTFTAADELVLVDGDGGTWQVRRHDDRLRAVDPRSLPAEAHAARRPRPMTCSPTGWLPVHDGRTWSWVEAPCAANERCVRNGPRLPAIRPTGLGLALGIQVSIVRGRARTIETETASGVARGLADEDADVQVLATLALSFDPWTAGAHRRRWRAMQRAAAAELALPPVPPGPLAAAQATAMRQAVCRGRR